MINNHSRKLVAVKTKPFVVFVFLLVIFTTCFAQQKPETVIPMSLQCTITGSSTVNYGQSYSYFISGCSATNWTVSCGTIQSHNSTSATILFNSPCGSATISAVGSGAANKTVTIIVSLLDGGTISNTSQSINYNTVPAAIVATAATGGTCDGYLYQWYSSADGDIFTAISGATGQNYQPAALTATTYYKRQVTCSGTAYTSNIAVVNVAVPPLSGGAINNPFQSINYNTVPASISATMATGGSCGSYTYQWFASTDNVNFNAISGATAQSYQPPALIATTYYKRQTACSGSYVYTTNNAAVIVVSPDLNYNLIRVRDIQKAGVTDSAAAAGLTNPYDVAQITQYFDGLGRPIQTVAMQQSPLQNDLVSFNVYDAFGREAVKYLPYTATSNDGLYKTAALADQNIFNAAQFPGEQYYYSQTNFEPSPLNRVDTALMPGQSWVGSNKGVSQQYQINQASDSVRLWNIGFTPGSLPATSSIYAAGTLYKNITTDEAGHSVVEYKDMEGKVVLKKVQLDSNPGTAHAGWLCTYYIYDDLNNLRFVIQPLGVQLINPNWTITTAIANELCFRYEYDYRKRMIIKKIPGAGEAWMVYDFRDRLVMSQDSSLRFQQKWMYIRYDDQNRPDSTGLITDPSNYNNLAYHQGLASNSISYPNLASYTSELLTQTYYDNYDWVSGTGTSLSTSMATNYTTSSNYFITGYNTSPTYSQPLTQFNITRGMVTGTRTKVIGTANQYLYAVNIYDDRGRVIQTQSVNYTGGIDTSIVQYSFNGKPLRSLLLHRKNGTNAQNHKILTKMDYDGGGRLLTINKNIDNASSDQLIANNTYNELGQLQNKQLGNNLENLAYDYSIRGWLTSINKNYIAGSSSNYFGMELGYDKTASVSGTTSYLTPQYNGNIEGAVWKSKGDGINRKYDFTYDNVNRLLAANFLQNTTGSTWDNSYLDFTTSNLKYDANGNILSMNQKGFKINGSGLIDQLTYTYQTNSNKLSKVDDIANDPASKLGDFHYSGTKQATDYSYDGNGNLTVDNNKAISSIVYNHLNLPNQVNVTGKGTITYTYDAAGNKLVKTTVDNTTVPSKTTTTTYIGGIVYQNDTLQFIPHEEGRARWALHKYTNGTSGYGFEYDYFLKDHLGNVRMVLTQEKDTAKYIATMEAAYRNTESQLFSTKQLPTKRCSRLSY